MYLQKVISKKKLEGHWRKWQDPDPIVRGMDPWIRIRTKISWIRNNERPAKFSERPVLRIRYVYPGFQDPGFATLQETDKRLTGNVSQGWSWTSRPSFISCVTLFQNSRTGVLTAKTSQNFCTVRYKPQPQWCKVSMWLDASKKIIKIIPISNQ
jgi:hypothetical protein